MGFRDADRGQAIQVGAVLLFAVLIVAFSSYQAFVVPNQNREVEFSHNQRVQNQLQDVRNGILDAASGDESAISVTLGVRYPSRTLALNPGPASGALRTAGTTDAGVQAWVNNSVASGETGDYWDGINRSFNTGVLRYQPNYNVYGNAPTTIYEHSVLVNRFRDSTVPVTGQTLIRDDEIRLVTLNGSLAVSQSGSVSVDLQSVSASTRSVMIANDTSENITIAVPTRLSQSVWRDLLSDQSKVVNVSVETTPGEAFDRLEVRLEPGQYELRLSRVGIGSGVRSPGAQYLTDVVGNNSQVPENGRQSIVVEVRDQFNNPVSGVTIRAVADGGSLSPSRRVSDDEGRASFSFQAPDVDGSDNTARVNVSIVGDPATGFDPEAMGNVSLQVDILNVDGSGTGGGGGGGGAYAINWNTPSGTGITCADICTLNASKSTTASLTADTTPTAVGAEVDFSVNDTSNGTVLPASDTTDTAGEASTTLTAQSNGPVNVYAYSGAGGDTLTFNITDFGGGVGTGFAVFRNDSNSNLRSVQPGDPVETYSTSRTPTAVGQSTPALDADSDVEIPYRLTAGGPSRVKIINQSGSTSTLFNEQGPNGVVPAEGTRMVVADLASAGEPVSSDSTPQLLFRDSNNNLYSWEDGQGNPSQISAVTDVAALGGVGDFDGDGIDDDLVYIGSNNDQVRYFDSSAGTIETSRLAAADSDAIGQPGDFDGDSSEEVPYVNSSSGEIELATVGGNDGSFSFSPSGPGLSTTPMGTEDWDGDGDLDILFVDGNQQLRYVDTAGNLGTAIENYKLNTATGVTTGAVP